MKDQNRTLHTDASAPPDVAGIAAQLDALAQADRAAAPRGLEDRLVASFAAARSHGEAAPEQPNLRFPVERVAGRPMWRLAASLGLSAAVLGGLTWVATLAPVNPSGTVAVAGASDANELAEDIEQFLASTDAWDLGVSASIASAREAIDSASSDKDFWNDSSSDGLLLEDTL